MALSVKNECLKSSHAYQTMLKGCDRVPAAAHKGAIQFGLVYIPVALHTAVSTNDISFHQLHKDSHARIRYKKVREDTGQEVQPNEIVKGYQYEPNKYVVLTETELEQMKSEKDRAITILQFVKRDSIQPVYFEKSYYVTPDSGSDKAYSLLLAAMEQENVTAIAKSVLGTKENIMALSALRGCILLETLYYQEEIKPVPQSLGSFQISSQEMNMAKMLIQSMTGNFQPEQYHETYTQRLKEAIQQKINGQQFTVPAHQQSGNVINLMDALQRSIQQQPRMWGS